MTTFVGTEYLLAHALIKQSEKGGDAIPISDAVAFGENVQKYFNETNIHAVAVRHSIKEVIWNWPEYFKLTQLNGIAYIQIAPHVLPQDLKQRFIGYLPIDVLKAIIETELP